jgi:hypothetical protein
MSDANPEEVLRFAQNFIESRILLSGAELNPFTNLSQTPLSAQEVASGIGADLRALTILLDTLSAMGLLVKQSETYQCEDFVYPFLSEDAPHSVLPMVLHAALLWQKWSGLTDVVRGTIVSRDVAKSSRSVEDLRVFIEAMDVIAAPRAHEIVAAANPGPSKAHISLK